MIKEISKNSKGITIISLMVAIVLILILTNVVVFNVQDGLANQKLERLQADISNLKDQVSQYYADYGAIPTSAEYTGIEDIQNAGLISSATDIGKFYVLDLSKFENLILNYGEDFKKVTKEMSQDEANKLKDIYIINETSHNIFYVKGIKVHGKMYYTDYNAEDIDTQTVDIKYIDNVKIPAGFNYISGTKDTGIKIEGADGNQYVWVPVEDYDEFVKEEEDSATQNADRAEKTKELENVHKSVKLNKGFYVSISEVAAVSMNEEESEVVTTTCQDVQVRAIEKWINEKEGRAETLNYTKDRMQYRLTLLLTNDEKWSATYQSEDGKQIKYKDKYENEVYIPNGFQVSETEGSNKVSEGLVIRNATTLDRYVWIPVPKSVFKTAENSENYEAIENDLKEYTAEYNGEKKSEDALENEEEKAENTENNEIIGNELEQNTTENNTSEGNGLEGNTTDNEEKQGEDTYFKECGLTEDEYNNLKNEMLSSIYKNKGFWMSQYEIGANAIAKTSNDSVERNATSQENQYVYNYVSVEDAQKIASNMDTDRTSSLLFGIQWDLACKFIATNSKVDVMQSADWANYKDSEYTLDKGQYTKINYVEYTEVTKEYDKKNEEILLATGITARNSILNIYDFAGNVAEWTLEKGPDDKAIARGGSFKDQSASAVDRAIGKDNSQEIGFRVAIY